MTTQLVPVGDIERMAVAIAKSNLFGMKTPEQAMSLMLISQAEGMHPAIACRDYDIIQGRAAMKSNAMQARFQAAGGSLRWLEYTDEKVSAEFSHPAGGQVEVSWDMARAKKAGLAGKENWNKYPRQMLAARVISEGVKRVFPGAANGMYTPEEVMDMPPLPKVEREIVGERVEPIRPGRQQIEADIDSAESLAALESLVPRIQSLPAEDRNVLRSRYATRKHLLAKSLDAKQDAELRQVETADNWGDPLEAA